MRLVAQRHAAVAVAVLLALPLESAALAAMVTTALFLGVALEAGGAAKAPMVSIQVLFRRVAVALVVLAIGMAAAGRVARVAQIAEGKGGV
jgi:hypothetical protein